jgi:drug/metabolite transporter (DMT)-like permease
MNADSTPDAACERPLLPASVTTRRRVPIAWVVIALVCVQAIFGGNSVILKVAITAQADPVVFSFLRDVGGAACLLLACRFNGSLMWPRPEHHGAFIALGVLGVYISMMFQTLALVYVTPLNAALLQPSQPVLTTFFAAFFGVEALQANTLHGRLKLGGVLLSATGAVCTVYWSSQQGGGSGGTADDSVAGASVAAPPSTAPRLVVGNVLLVVQCVAGALYQLIQKHLLTTADYPPLLVAAYGYLVGAVAVGLVLPVCSLETASWAFLWQSRTAAAGLAYCILMTSALNYGLQAFANKHSSPVLVTAFFPLQMVFTALFSWWALHQQPKKTDYLGALMIVCGLAAVTAGRIVHARRAGKSSASPEVVVAAHEGQQGAGGAGRSELDDRSFS